MDPEVLRIVTSVEGERKVIRLIGEVDLQTVSSLLPALRTAVDSGGSIVIDLSEVRYIDSQGVRALRTTYQQSMGSGAAMRLRGCHGMVGRVLRTVGLDRVIPMEEE